MTPAQEAELIGGGDCFAHWHSEDRRATQDLLHSLQSVASTTTISSDTTLRGTEDIVLVDTTAGNVVLTLFRPVNGQEITLVKTSPLNTLTIVGTSTWTYTTQWSTRTFKAIDGAWVVINSHIRDKFPHGAFSSTETEILTTANVPQRLTVNVTDYSRDVVHVSGDGIHVAQSGLYNLQFSIQFTNTDTQLHDAWVWLRKGVGVGTAVDIPNTASTVTINGTHGGLLGHLIIAANFFVYLNVDDFVELWWTASSTTVAVETLAPLASVPGSPSMVVTLSYVSSETSNA